MAKRRLTLKEALAEKEKVTAAVKALNAKRAKRIRTILGRYYARDDLETSASDMLADLLHWCRQTETWFDDIMASANKHFEAERAEHPDDLAEGEAMAFVE